MRSRCVPATSGSPAAALVKRFLESDRGLAITEYGLLVTLIAIVVVAVVVVFGGGIRSWFGTRTGSITTY